MIIDGQRAADAATTLVLACYAAYNRRDWEGLLATVSENVAHDVNQGEREHGRAAFREFLQRRARFCREELRDVVVMASADGTRAAAEFVVHGTYLATEPGMPPARGQSYAIPGGAFFECAHGKITRLSNYFNAQEWLRQISVGAA